MSYLSVIKIYIFLFFHVIIFSQNKEWIDSPPSSDDSKYVGIGWASTNQSDYSLEAEQSALRSIALEINTQISGQTRRRVISINDISEREFENEYIVSTLGNFKGLQKIDDFVDEKNERYYIYFEYSKSTHRKNIEDTKKQVIDLVKEYESIENESFVLRLQKLVYTYESLFQLYGEDVFSNVNGRNVNLQSFVPSEISKLIRSIKLVEPNPVAYQGVYQNPLKSEILFQAKLKLPRSVEIDIDNLPFAFGFEGGSGDFSYSDVSSAEGLVVQEVSKITSKIPRQIVVSYVDLKSLKKGTAEFYHLDKALDKISAINKIRFKIIVSLVNRDAIFFGVSFSEGIPNTLMEQIRQNFEVSFNRNTEFKIVDRQIVTAILERLGLDEQDLCTKSECDAEVGKELGVRRMIKINVKYNSRDGIIETYFTDTDVQTLFVSTQEPYHTSVKRGNLEKTILNNIDTWVIDFYDKLNPPSLNIKSDITGVKVRYKRIKRKSDVSGAQISYKEKYQTLPLIDLPVDPGTYELVFEKDGYETNKQEVSLGATSDCCDDVDLKEKTRFKAFFRSLFIPGSGQRYGADSRNQNRSSKALLHTSIALVATAATVYVWYAFTQSQNSYDEAQLAYSRATSVSGIESTRKESIIANQNMNQNYNTAIAVSAIMTAFSIYSGVDAAVTLPKY